MSRRGRRGGGGRTGSAGLSKHAATHYLSPRCRPPHTTDASCFPPPSLTSGSVRTPSPVRTSCSASRGGVMRGVGVGTSRRSAAGQRDDGPSSGKREGWLACGWGHHLSFGLCDPQPAARAAPPGPHPHPLPPHPRSKRATRCREPPESEARPAAPGTGGQRAGGAGAVRGESRAGTPDRRRLRGGSPCPCPSAGPAPTVHSWACPAPPPALQCDPHLPLCAPTLAPHRSLPPSPPVALHTPPPPPTSYS